MTGYDGVTPAE